MFWRVSIIRKDKARCENKKLFQKGMVLMAISRKDPKGRKLREGENWRNDGRYSYRYTDVRTGKRLTVYAQDLPELREKEKQIAKDMEDNILTDGAIKKMTLNTLFERYRQLVSWLILQELVMFVLGKTE